MRESSVPDTLTAVTPWQEGWTGRKPSAVYKVIEFKWLHVVVRLDWARHCMACDVQLATFSFQRVCKSLLYVLPRMCAFPTEPWTRDVKET